MANASAPKGSTGSYQASPVIPSPNGDWLRANHARYLAKEAEKGNIIPRRF